MYGWTEKKKERKRKKHEGESHQSVVMKLTVLRVVRKSFFVLRSFLPFFFFFFLLFLKILGLEFLKGEHKGWTGHDTSVWVVEQFLKKTLMGRFHESNLDVKTKRGD